MPEVLLIGERELRELVALDAAAVDTVEAAFAALASGEVVVPPVLRLDMPAVRGEIDVKTAWIPGLERLAVKISPGFFDNPKLGLPSLLGLMVVLSARTGMVEAVLLDNGLLTDIRTAAAGAVAAKWLAPPDARIAGIVGTGRQARLQLEALRLVRPVERALVWGRRPAAAEAFAREAAEALGIPVEPVDLPTVVRESEVVVTTTPAEEPLVRAEWLHPGLHITAMGSDAEHKNELEPAVLGRADLYVCDLVTQCARLGELHHAIRAGVVPADVRPPELGEIVTGRHPGRPSAEAVTVCDLTGTGAQDTAIADFAVRRARERGVGTPFRN